MALERLWFFIIKVEPVRRINVIEGGFYLFFFVFFFFFLFFSFC